MNNYTAYYTITIKEKNKPRPLRTSYSGKEVTEEYLIEFFGLKEPDVEWYKIQRI